MSGASGAAATRGGADTSLENNNVYGLEPKVYLEGSGLPVGADTTTVTETPAKPGMDVATVATATAGLLAFSGAAVGGTAFAIYKEVRILLLANMYGQPARIVSGQGHFLGGWGVVFIAAIVLSACCALGITLPLLSPSHMTVQRDKSDRRDPSPRAHNIFVPLKDA